MLQSYLGFSFLYLVYQINFCNQDKHLENKQVQWEKISKTVFGTELKKYIRIIGTTCGNEITAQLLTDKILISSELPNTNTYWWVQFCW